MKKSLIIAFCSIILIGCGPSSPDDMTIKKVEVNSVTITDPTIPKGVGGSSNTNGELSEKREGPYKTYYRTDFSRIFIESDNEWLKITRVFKKDGVKETTVDYYKPSSLVKFSTKNQ